MYKVNEQKANEVFDKKNEFYNLTIKELTILFINNQYKRKEQGKIPNKKEEELDKKCKGMVSKTSSKFRCVDC